MSAGKMNMQVPCMSFMHEAVSLNGVTLVLQESLVGTRVGDLGLEDLRV
jgi:hypothetical protein